MTFASRFPKDERAGPWGAPATPAIPLLPRELAKLLRELCVPGLSRRQLQILGACALGYSTQDTAVGLGLSRATVFRHVQLLQARIFDCTDLTPNRFLLGAWAYYQKDCCASVSWRLIENNQLFETSDQPPFGKGSHNLQ